MGAEGSKGGGKNVTKYSWLTTEERNAVNSRIKEIQGSSPAVSVSTLQTAVSSSCGEELGTRFTKLLCGWQAKANKNGTSQEMFPAEQLAPLLYQALNPEPSVQASIVVTLSTGKEDAAVNATQLVQYVSLATRCYCTLSHVCAGVSSSKMLQESDDVSKGSSNCQRIAIAWLHDLLFDGATHKQTAGKDIPDKVISCDSLERWLLGHSALFSVVQFTLLRTMVAPNLSTPSTLMPQMTLPKKLDPRVSRSEVLLLNTALPMLLRSEWRLLFSNQMHGDSFSLLMKQIVGAGPTLVIVEDDEGNRFGGFGAASWEVRPQFHGTAENFLFSLSPSSGIYRPTGYNTNYQYLNFLHNNTMPNGLGMGGREELFGLFLSSDFGECQISPTCTTFQSPPLCPNSTPKVRFLTVWGVGEEPKDSSDEDEDDGCRKKRSALDKNPDATAMLDMIGRTRASDGLREPDPDSD